MALPRFSRLRGSPLARAPIMKCLKRKGRDCSQSNIDDAFPGDRDLNGIIIKTRR